MLHDDGDRRKRHYIHSFRIFQPQPSRGKKRRILTRSKPHTAGNTSSREDNTTLNRNFQQSLVPTDSVSYPQIRLSAIPGSCWFRVLSSDQTFCSPWFLLVSVCPLFLVFESEKIPVERNPGFWKLRSLNRGDSKEIFKVPALWSEVLAGKGASLATSSKFESTPGFSF
ncbi:hypothetical protein F2Q68_00009753 [Brassica cretica]|uniref:Uncharacterized protein n=1 Tax=Brassica cretica TaxID=69181 RepID=A0A8S9KPG0_BRACR|nr:hypothetical protein F2Q68_00009753 [Brassica cretica]